MVTVLVASRTVPPLAMSAYDLVLALPCSARTARMAAVNVVLPWSMCPIVPTLTCGLVLVNVSFAIAPRLCCDVLCCAVLNALRHHRWLISTGETRPARPTRQHGPSRAILPAV